MSASKSFKLIDPGFPGPSTSASPAGTNWDLCLLCLEDKAEQLTRPSKSKRMDAGSGYTSLAENLKRFHELGQLPRTIHLETLDKGCDLEATMIAHSAQYHKTCSLKFNNTMLNRAEKRNLKDDGNNQDTDKIVGRKRIRSNSSDAAKTVQESLCFFCRQAPGAAGFREAATLKLDCRVRTCAMILEDTDLLARLSAGDVVALDVKYHAKCLVGLYNRARKAEAADSEETLREKQVAASVFAELVLYIEETSLEQNTAPVFKLVDLARLYTTRLE